MSLRVLFAIGSMDAGGSERQLVGILRYLDRSAFTPLLYTIYRGGGLVREVPADVPVHSFAERFEPSRWNYPGRLYRRQARHLAETLRREKVQVLYARTFQMGLVAHAAVRLAPLPWVSVEVSDPRIGFRDITPRFFRIKRWLLRRAYRNADRVVAVSEGVREGLLGYFRLPPNQVVTINNFLDLDRLDRMAAESAPALEPGRFHLVAAGRLVNAKGYIHLLQAVEEVVHRQGRKEFLLRILGDGPLEGELKAFARARNLENHVRFEGFVPNPYAVMSRAHLFCLSSVYEGMPNALLEAMACRVPVLSCDCLSGPRQILEGGRYGRLVPPADAAALAEAIVDAMSHPGPWLEKVGPARAHIEREFSPEAGIARLQQLLEEVHASSRRLVSP
ncbi:MAG: glycosyltransferase [Planctomycetes bacterium]|nr:glycosyltransferase [Planctomycetota bacterium]